jgi:2,4'-dihydroxyacetophenone dioxygenase
VRARGFTHVSISATDLEESVRFYTDFFGMEEVPSPDFSGPVRWLRVGDLQLHLFLDEDPAPERHHFALDVDDFEAAYRRAEELGVRDGGRYSSVRELPDGAVQMYLRDPAGNLVEVNWPDVTTLDREVIPEIQKIGGDPKAVLYLGPPSSRTLRHEQEEKSMTQERTEQVISDLGLPDQAIQSDELPWVPQGERVWFKPLRFDLATGRWINVLKVEGSGKVNRHRHTGGQVMGFCLEGSWHYLERDWVARPGTLVYEPPGDIHTLVVDEGVEEMQTLFILEGTVQYIDDNDDLIYQDDVFSKLERYLKFCDEQGIEPQDLRY